MQQPCLPCPTEELPQRQEHTCPLPWVAVPVHGLCTLMITRSLLSAGTGGADFIGGVWLAGPVQGMVLFRLGTVVPECSQAGQHPRVVPASLIAGGASEESTVVHHTGLALLLNPGRSLQWDPPWGFPLDCSSWEFHRGIPRNHGERHGVSHLQYSKGQKESPCAFAHTCCLVI